MWAGVSGQVRSMASSKEFVEYAAEQLRDAGNISWRKMFGEYGWYCDGKFMGVICDNQLFIKITPETANAFPNNPKALPYEGAKEYFWVEDIENRELLTKLAQATWKALPQPKPKRGKKNGGI